MSTLTLLWLRYQFWCADQNESLCRWRYYLAAAIILFSVVDLVLTQEILTYVGQITETQRSEANPIMAPIVMTWWAWPIRVGIPCFIVFRHLKVRAYNVMAFGALLFGGVVAWNSYMYRLVLEAV